jgi:hypothetical protein
VVLAVTIAAAVGINLFELAYNRLQTAPNAAAFQHTLGNQARAIAATCCDIVFAAGYATLGLIALRVLDVPRRLALPAAALIVASAVFDEVENLVLIRNIVAEDTLTDGWIRVMRIPGTLKWIGSPIFVVLLVALARRFIRQRRAG